MCVPSFGRIPSYPGFCHGLLCLTATSHLDSYNNVSTVDLQSKDDSDWLPLKKTTWSYSRFVYCSTFLCKPVLPCSQPIQICCTMITNIKRNYNMNIFRNSLTNNFQLGSYLMYSDRIRSKHGTPSYPGFCHGLLCLTATVIWIRTITLAKLSRKILVMSPSRAWLEP